MRQRSPRNSRVKRRCFSIFIAARSARAESTAVRATAFFCRSRPRLHGVQVCAGGRNAKPQPARGWGSLAVTRLSIKRRRYHQASRRTSSPKRDSRRRGKHLFSAIIEVRYVLPLTRFAKIITDPRCLAANPAFHTFEIRHHTLLFVDGGPSGRYVTITRPRGPTYYLPDHTVPEFAVARAAQEHKTIAPVS